MPIDLSNWMALVDDATTLSELSIPGTHDSASRYINSNRLTTQTDGIEEQLNAGIRFLDIRVGYTNGRFLLYHEDYYLNIRFGDLQRTLSRFLKAHPREAIIVSLKLEKDAPTSGNPSGVSFQKRFDQYVDEDPALWYLLNAIPTLRQVRGKLVLFRRFEVGKNTTDLGINAFDKFPNNGIGTIEGPPKLRVQDDFGQLSDSKDDKYKSLKKVLDEAVAPGHRNVLYVSFSSAAGKVSNDFPLIIANNINPRLLTYLSEHVKARLGIVAMDFQTNELTTAIASSNPLVGYWIADGNAVVTGRGDALPYAPSGTAARSAVAIAVRPDGTGYYLLASDGKVFPYGEAPNVGEGVPGAKQVVSMAVKRSGAAPSGLGYWILASNGKVAGHHANHYGEIPSSDKAEAVSIVATPNGDGYWILTTSGRVYPFRAGDFGDQRKAGKVAVSMAVTPTGLGYWILSSDGTVRPFGDAVALGQGVGSGPTARAIAATPDGTGYWILTTDGSIYPYGTAADIGGARSTTAFVGIAVKRP